MIKWYWFQYSVHIRHEYFSGSIANNRTAYDRSNSNDDASGILSSSGGSVSLPFDSQSLKSSHNSNITSYSHRSNRPGSSISNLSGALTDSGEDSYVLSSSAPVFTWGSSSPKPLMLNLPQRNLQVIRVDVSRTQKMGVTNCGQIVIWEVK